MSDDADAGEDVVTRISADEAFELLGDETRLGILRALSEADGPMAFSELRSALEARDSGRFNYHLDRLAGHFVSKTEEGYELTAAGAQTVGAILSGQYTKRVESDPIRVDADCPRCGGPLAGFFEAGSARVACEECEQAVTSLNVPPGVYEDYPREEWPYVAERWTRREFETSYRGFCPTCHGPVSRELDPDPPAIPDVYAVGVDYTCDRCASGLVANVEAHVVFHPAVVSFHHEHGIDIEATPIWELDWPLEPRATLVSEAPPRAEVPIEIDGDRLVLTVDEGGEVIGECRG